MSTGKLVCSPLIGRSGEFENLKEVGFIEKDDKNAFITGGSIIRSWKIGESIPEEQLQDIHEYIYSLYCSADESSFLLVTEVICQEWDAETGEMKEELRSLSTEEWRRAIPIGKEQSVPNIDETQFSVVVTKGRYMMATGPILSC